MISAFQETGDRSNFQGRYILRHPWTGGDSCAAATQYRQALRERHEQQAQTLASLTGWDIEAIRQKMGTGAMFPTGDNRSWWERIWNR